MYIQTKFLINLLRACQIIEQLTLRESEWLNSTNFTNNFPPPLLSGGKILKTVTLMSLLKESTLSEGRNANPIIVELVRRFIHKNMSKGDRSFNRGIKVP